MAEHPARWSGALFLAAAGGVLSAALFFGGGSDDTRLFWVGGGALVLAGIGAAAGLLGLLPQPSLAAPGAAFLALLAAFVAWSGCSIVWSIEGDRSWSYLNRDLALLAFAVAGVLAGATAPRATRIVAGGLAALLAGVVVWALLGKIAPGLGPDVSRNARLRSPVGYWNALAVLGVMALLLGLWVAARKERRPALRAGGVVLVYAAIVVVVLTFSRGGIAIAALAVGAWLLLGGALVETILALAVAAPAAAAVCAWAFSRPALVDAGHARAERAHDGWVFGLVLLAGAVLAVAVFWWLRRSESRRQLSPERRRTLVRGALSVAGGLAALALAVSVVRASGPGEWARARLDEFATPAPVIEGPTRLSAGSSNYRWTWWRQAWSSFENAPIKGTGAGSFELAHRVYRKTYSPPALEPHNLALQVLSETGLVGFALLAGALLAAAAGVAGSLRGLRGDERSAAAALTACLAAYGLHVLVDIGWDYVAISGPAFFLLGLLVSICRPPRERARRPLPAVAVLALAATAVASLATPWLADRRIDSAFVAVTARDYARAATIARRAHDLNPLSLQALYTWALAEEARPRLGVARRLYVDAVDLQPKNPDTWYALGDFEATVLHDCLLGYEHLNQSYTLDRFGPAGEHGGLLDKTRAAVNKGRRRCQVRERVGTASGA